MMNAHWQPLGSGYWLLGGDVGGGGSLHELMGGGLSRGPLVWARVTSVDSWRTRSSAFNSSRRVSPQICLLAPSRCGSIGANGRGGRGLTAAGPGNKWAN